MTYQTQATCEPRDATAAMITAGADALASKRSELVGPFVDVLVDLAVKDVTDEELKSVRASIEPSLHGEAAALAQLHAAAMNHLIGAPLRTAEDIRAELAGLGAADYQRVAREALATGLAMVPPGQAVGRAGFTQAPTFSADRVQGSEYPLVNRPPSSSARSAISCRACRGATSVAAWRGRCSARPATGRTRAPRPGLSPTSSPWPTQSSEPVDSLSRSTTTVRAKPRGRGSRFE